MKIKLPDNVTRAFGSAGIQLKKHSPEILVVAGVIGTVASAVMACKATTKVNDILEESKETVEVIHESAAQGYVKKSNGEQVPYSEEDGKKDLTIVYTQTGLKFVKLYAPAVLLGALSITSIVASHNILRKRNIALAAAYATIDKGFKEYRGRVVERFGKELDRELKYNIKAKEVEEVVLGEDGNPVVNKKTGEVKTQKTTVAVADPNYNSDYARFFDETCAGWQRDAELNLYFLRQQQNYANEKLNSQGYLFLNDVYMMLGIPKTKAGQIVGWVYDKSGKFSDNFVDFGIYDLYNEKARDFVNGREKSILLDFNVDGNILDLI